ncbi:Lanosterol synthase (Oxidosqualene--lanosterol cyclase) [Marasmius tenuissimus]|nr:Lanosterol synthase (Oxidosqualene--lanosterol cyclase) [Marasmius tenuissimus]
MVSSLQLPPNPVEPVTDYSRWRLRSSNDGRHTWHYLRTDEECAKWPQTALDRYWLGLPTGLPKSAPADNAYAAAHKGFEFYKHLQDDDGHWPGEYGGTMFMLPAIVIGSYICGMDLKEEERFEMARYLVNLANPEDGGWGLHVEGESTVFGTGLNYVSLRLLGVSADHPACVKARQLLHRLGGAVAIPTWGKFWLALLNVYDWAGVNSPFPELHILPHWIPFHSSRWWVHSRFIYQGLCYLYGIRYRMEENNLILALREELYVENFYSIKWPKERNNVAKVDIYAPHSPLYNFLSDILYVYEQCPVPPLRQAAIDRAYHLIIAEDENTGYQGIAPLSKMFNAIARFSREGSQSEAYKLHAEMRADFMWQGPEGMRVSGTNGSQLWDAAFMAQALVDTKLAEMENNQDNVLRLLKWLDEAQMLSEPKHPDITYRESTKGAWGFSTKTQGFTVSDCTAEALKAIISLQRLDFAPKRVSEERLCWAVDLLLSLQNSNGGVASYELIRAPRWIESLNPAEIFENTLVDSCHIECTTSVMTALSVFKKEYPHYRTKEITRAVEKGISFIREAQTSEGGWYGFWGICFSYATMFALECLSLSGEDYSNSPSVQRACDYLISKQREDGGWGEDFKTCLKEKWVDHEDTQVVQTCWAAMALMHGRYPHPEPIERAVKLVMSRQLPDGSWKQEAIEGVFNKTCSIAYPNFKFSFTIWMLGKAHRYLEELKGGQKI